MKVKIEFTVDIDPEAWAEEYGLARGDVREDVKAWVSSQTITQIHTEGLWKPVHHVKP